MQGCGHCTLQNIQLYSFGVLFNGLGLVASGAVGDSGGSGLSISPLALTRGYTALTYAVVANLAFSGLVVSWVMKFADSIMKASGSKVTLCCRVLLRAAGNVHHFALGRHCLADTSMCLAPGDLTHRVAVGGKRRQDAVMWRAPVEAPGTGRLACSQRSSRLRSTVRSAGVRNLDGNAGDDGDVGGILRPGTHPSAWPWHCHRQHLPGALLLTLLPTFPCTSLISKSPDKQGGV